MNKLGDIDSTKSRTLAKDNPINASDFLDQNNIPLLHFDNDWEMSKRNVSLMAFNLSISIIKSDQWTIVHGIFRVNPIFKAKHKQLWN